MSNDRTPMFSVVIPTVDRAHLLPGAIASALAQTETDLEVVVVDNGSVDDTPSVVREFDDARIRYVRRGARHPMHESWRYALDQARGRSVTVLCDDDALHPRALACAHRAATRHRADVVCWRACTHYAADWPGPERGTVRFGPPYADRPFRIDGRRLVDLVYELRVTFTDLVPKLLNTLVSRELLDRIAAVRGQLFPPSACPDYSAMLGLAARAEGVVLLDAPLTVTGASPESIGASAPRRGEAARAFLADLTTREKSLLLPAAVGPPVTWLAQTLMQCADADYAFAGRTVDPVNLYGLAGLDLAEAERNGIDVERERADYEAALAGPLAPHAGDVRAFVAEGRVIACESFLSPVADGETVLGLGAFRADEVEATQAGGPRAADVAAGLDAWLSRASGRLAPTLEAMRMRAGDRAMVLFGLGRNGRALRRAWRDARSAAVVDDRIDRAPPDVVRLRPEDLDPRRHFVVVTPTDAEAIVQRLEKSGFAREVDAATVACPVRGIRTASTRLESG